MNTMPGDTGSIISGMTKVKKVKLRKRNMVRVKKARTRIKDMPKAKKARLVRGDIDKPKKARLHGRSIRGNTTKPKRVNFIEQPTALHQRIGPEKRFVKENGGR